LYLFKDGIMARLSFLSGLMVITSLAGTAFAQSPTPLNLAPLTAPAPAETRVPISIDDAPVSRGFLESDRAFPGFIGPISNPVLSKDPRSITDIRFLFINDVIPSENELAGGNFQVYAAQIHLAITERLTLIADKDGIANIHSGALGNSSGLLNMSYGLRYLLARDVENQFLWSAGFLVEPNMGYASVFQNHGSGVMTTFTTVGKEFGDSWHVLNTFGYQFGFEDKYSSSFFYNSFHIDRQFFGYNSGGDWGQPNALGEGDGLLNLGTTGMAGHNLVTLALGMKARLRTNVETGFAWEFPLSNQKDLMDNRLICEFIVRY
jgi:hypothetical protein